MIEIFNIIKITRFERKKRKIPGKNAKNHQSLIVAQNQKPYFNCNKFNEILTVLKVIKKI